MRILDVVFSLAILVETSDRSANEIPPADAIMPEHIRSAILRLSDADFRNRETAADELLAMGIDAVYPLTVTAENESHEVSVRAFDLLQRLYRGDHEPTHEAVERAFQKLEHAENLSVAARAERNLENDSETRQWRAIVQFERLGGIIHFRDPNADPQPINRSTVEYIALTRTWIGGDVGLQLLSRMDDVRNSRAVLFIIRGVEISEESTQNLRAELPFLTITRRGPARLGVRQDQRFQRDVDGCIISEVEPGSAADRAGLRTNDVITEIDGQPINDFQTLIQVIETKEPGDKIPVVFRRGIESKEAEVELYTWTKQSRPKERPEKFFGSRDRAPDAVPPDRPAGENQSPPKRKLPE